MDVAEEHIEYRRAVGAMEGNAVGHSYAVEVPVVGDDMGSAQVLRKTAAVDTAEAVVVHS